MVNNSIETFKSETKETIKINSLDELKKEFGVEKIQGIEEDFKQPLITSKKELLKLKEKFTTNETSNKLKEFLEGKGVFENIGEKFKKNSEYIKNNIKQKEDLETSTNGLKETGKAVDEALEKAFDKTGDSEVGKKVKETFDSAKAKASELGEKAFWEKLETIPFIGGIFSFLKNIFNSVKGFFSFGDKLNSAKEKLKPEEIEKTKEEIKNILIKSIPGKNFKGREEAINRIVNSNDISYEQIEKLYKIRKENGELKFSDIQQNINIDPEKILTKEEIEIGKERGIKSITDYIGEQYGINFNLEPNKREKIRTLIEKNLQVDTVTINTIKEEKEGRIRDIAPLIIESASNFVSFTIGLVTGGIVSAGDISLNLADSYGETFMLGIDTLPFVENGSIENLIQKTENMSNEERMLLFQILQRKSSFLGTILGNISYFLSTIALEGLTDTTVKGHTLAKQISLNDIDGQIKSFEKLEKHLTKTDKISGKLKTSIKQIQGLRKNAEIIKTLNSAKKISDLKNLPNNLYGEVTELTDIKEARKIISSKLNTPNVSFIDTAKGEIMAWGLDSTKIQLEQKVQSISSLQKQMARGDMNMIKKYKAALEGFELSRTVDGVVYEGLSKKAALDKMTALKQIANESPDLLRSILHSGATLGFLGLAVGMNEKDNFIEAITKELGYITRVVGPINLIIDFGFSGKSGSIETIGSAGAGVGVALLAIDTMAIVKIFGTNQGITKSLVESGKYIVQPISDIGKATVSTISQLRNIKNLSLADGKINFSAKDILKKSVENVKNIKVPKKVQLAIALGLFTFGYLEYKIHQKDEMINDLLESGVINKDGTIDQVKSKELFSTFDKKEINYITKTILQNHIDFDISDLSIEINGNELVINSDKEKDVRKYYIFSKNVKNKIKSISNIEIFNFKEKAA